MTIVLILLREIVFFESGSDSTQPLDIDFHALLFCCPKKYDL